MVHTKHGQNYPQRRWLVLKNRIASYLSDRVVAVSGDSAHIACTVERAPARKVLVIRNGVDLVEFPERPRRRANRGFRAINVAGLNGAKGQADLLRAVRAVVDVEPSFRLDFVGDGPLRNELTSLRDELGLAEHVRFLGLRDDVREQLAAADAFVLASVSEGLSISLLEAMAAGLPTIATRVGGNPEVVVHGRTGLLVPPRSPASLAEALLELIRDPERARHMGQAGRRRAEESFDVRRVVNTYEELYLSILAKKRNGRAYLVERNGHAAACDALAFETAGRVTER
jgi:glycosyltransferase involved in cell wall biosynthesis